MQTLLVLAERVGRGEHERGAASNTVVIVAIVGAVLLAIMGRLVTHGMDSGRIRKYAESQGWELLDCQWRLLGPGWFGSRRERIYQITYRDREGRTHTAYTKTSALAGVYLTEDRVTDGAST